MASVVREYGYRNYKYKSWIIGNTGNKYGIASIQEQSLAKRKHIKVTLPKLKFLERKDIH